MEKEIRNNLFSFYQPVSMPGGWTFDHVDTLKFNHLYYYGKFSTGNRDSQGYYKFFDNKTHFKEQDHSKSTYAKKIKKEEGKINWEDSNLKIIGKINGLYPNPGGWFEFKGERYKILKAEKSILSGKSGYVLSDNFEIGCGENSIKIIEIQRQGKTVQKTKEFLRGSQITKGTDLN